LVVLAVPPILTSTYAGVEGVDPAARDAAYGMGMTGQQVLFRVETPCALPLVLSGIRSAMLQVISTATVAAYVSLGGLGRFVIDGLASQDYPQMLGGALLVAALAIVVEAGLAGVQRLVVPRGLSGRFPRAARASVDRKEKAVAPEPVEAGCPHRLRRRGRDRPVNLDVASYEGKEPDETRPQGRGSASGGSDRAR